MDYMTNTGTIPQPCISIIVSFILLICQK